MANIFGYLTGVNVQCTQKAQWDPERVDSYSVLEKYLYFPLPLSWANSHNLYFFTVLKLRKRWLRQK